ncbi:hypothetical protein CcaverHIS002_0400710 [Cutaneotrichosporon cavernicola]|nr:hypothetical protein CcaverHIS002_0400710 [Cutaneotrichosporon cavernicola]
MIPYLAILAILGSPAMAQGTRYAFQSDNMLCLGGMNEDDGLKMKVAECSENQSFDINFGETQVKVNHDDHDKCLDAGWEAAEGSQPTFQECNGADSQKFFFTNDGRIALMDRGLCIDAEDFHVELDKNIVLNTCHDGQASQGLVQVSGDSSSDPTGPSEEDLVNGGPWKIPTAVNSEMCLDEYNDNIEVRPCTYGDTNPWYMFKGDTQIRSADAGNTDKCLTAIGVVDGQITDGAQLMLETCRNGDPNQIFNWTDDNRLALRDSGLCIDVPDANAWPGAPLQLWTCGDGNTAQEWPVELATSDSPSHSGPNLKGSFHGQQLDYEDQSTDTSATQDDNTDHRFLCPSLLFHKDNSNKCLIWNFLDSNNINMVDCSRDKVGWTYDATTTSSTQIKLGDSCLTADQSDPNSMSVYVTDCDDNDGDQKFTVDGDHIKLEYTNMCLDVNFKDRWTSQGGRDSAEYIYATPSLLPRNNASGQFWKKRPLQPTCTDGDDAKRRYDNTDGYTKPEQHP